MEWKKEHLPTYLPYLGCALLTAASLAGLIAVGCICLKCCRPFCVGKENDDNDDEKRDKIDSRRFKRKQFF